MLIGHACKVKSHKSTRINADIYAHYQDVCSGADFKYALSEARFQILKEETKIERYNYQENFKIPLKRNIFGLYTISVYINHEPFSFIIDTGAQISGIKENKAKKLRMRKAKGNLTVGSIGGTQKAMQGFLADSLQFGAIEYRNQPLVQLSDADFSLRFGNIDLFTFDGILGWDILSQIDFEIDDIHKQFIVLKNTLKITNPNMIMGSFPCIIVTHPNGDTSLYGLDSGSRVSWIGEEAIRQHGYKADKETSSLGFGVHGLEKLQMKVVEHVTLYIDKAQIDLYATMSGRSNLFTSFTFDGVLGNEIFKGRRVRFINSKAMILLA